jgi:hypothetical protein
MIGDVGNVLYYQYHRSLILIFATIGRTVPGLLPINLVGSVEVCLLPIRSSMNYVYPIVCVSQCCCTGESLPTQNARQIWLNFSASGGIFKTLVDCPPRPIAGATY